MTIRVLIVEDDAILRDGLKVGVGSAASMPMPLRAAKKQMPSSGTMSSTRWCST